MVECFFRQMPATASNMAMAEVIGWRAFSVPLRRSFQLPTKLTTRSFPATRPCAPGIVRDSLSGTESGRSVLMDGATGAWFDHELSNCRLADERLTKRLHRLLERMGGAMGASIPLACQDWANTKAAYRFFSNDRISEADILAGHFQSTRERFAATDEPILILQDTTEFSFQREKADAIGLTTVVNSGKDKAGRVRLHTVCGLLMHSSLAVTTEGLPLGLAAIKFWTRKKFKGTAALKKKINPTRVPIEQKESVRWLENVQQSTQLLEDPERCVHVGDRESDIYELFCAGQEAGTHFLIRTCVDRLAGNGDHTIADEMEEVAVKGLHRIEVRDENG